MRGGQELCQQVERNVNTAHAEAHHRAEHYQPEVGRRQAG